MLRIGNASVTALQHERVPCIIQRRSPTFTASSWPGFVWRRPPDLAGLVDQLQKEAQGVGHPNAGVFSSRVDVAVARSTQNFLPSCVGMRAWTVCR